MPAPVVTITTPTNNATVSGTIPVNVTATDGDGILSVVTRVGTRTLTPQVGVSGSASKTFGEDTAFRLRPKAGPIKHLQWSALTSNSLGAVRSLGYSTVRVTFYIGGTSPSNPVLPGNTLPAGVFTQLNSLFTQLRAEGVTAMLGFSYGFDYAIPAINEPSLAQCLGHIDQLETILEDNKDVIACLVAPFMGAWGEEGKFGKAQEFFTGLCSFANKTAIKDRALLRFPQDRQIMFRYPPDIIAWYPTVLNQANAYGKVPATANQSRIALHIDSEKQDGWINRMYGFENGTKRPYSTPITAAMQQPGIIAQENYIRALAKWVFSYGEGGTLNQFVPDANGNASGFTRSQALIYNQDRSLGLENWEGFSKMNLWMDGSNPEAQLYKRSIGYNIWLKNYTINVTATTVNVTLNWEGIGTAGIHHKQPFFLELGGVQIQLSNDAREQIPRGSSTGSWTYSVPRPVGLVPGTYPIKFWLPDETVSLRTDWRYSIPISSTGMTFNQTDGRNYANQSIIVNSTGSGTGYNYSLNTLELPEGLNTITVTATDNVNEVSVTSIQINVDNVANEDTTPPTLVFFSPASGATVGGNVLVRTNTTDFQSGVDRVDYYIDDVLAASIPRQDGSTFHDYNWDTTAELGGTHVIKARCFDNAGNLTERLITVTVDNTGGIPVLNVLSPKVGAIIKGDNRVRITVEGDVVSVGIYIDNVLQITHNTTTGAAFYDYTWDSNTYPDGSHVIEARGLTSEAVPVNVVIPVIVDNINDPLPEDYYVLQVFTPTRRPVEGRTTSPIGLVANYSSADFTIPEWKVDGDGNLVSGFFKSIPLRQDGTRRVDIQKNDIVTFWFDHKPLFTALVDVPPNQDSMGAGVLADPQDYEVYELKSLWELLDNQLMPDVAFYNDRDEFDVTQEISPRRSISQLAKLLEKYLPTSVPKLHAATNFNAPHAEFYQPARTMRQVYQSLLESTNNTNMSMWFDAIGELHWDIRNTTLSLNMANLEGQLLPPEPGNLTTSVTFQLLGENKDPDGLKPSVLNREYTKPGTLKYVYEDPEHYKYGASQAFQIGIEPSMLIPLSDSADGAQVEINNVFDINHLPRIYDGNNDTYMGNNQLGAEFGISWQPQERGVFGVKLTYQLLTDSSLATSELLGRLYLNYIHSYAGADGTLKTVNSGALLELPSTGTTSAVGEKSSIELRFLPKRGQDYGKVEVQLLVDNLTLNNQIRIYEAQLLRLDTRPDKTLETLAKKLIVLPENDPGEVIIDSRNDPRPAQPIPGYVEPYSHLRLRYSSTDIRRRKVESIEYRFIDGLGDWESTLRWGRRDPPSDLADQIRILRNAAAKDKREATTLAVRRIES